jgi:hypothetical protein
MYSILIKIADAIVKIVSEQKVINPKPLPVLPNICCANGASLTIADKNI